MIDIDQEFNDIAEEAQADTVRVLQRDRPVTVNDIDALIAAMHNATIYLDQLRRQIRAIAPPVSEAASPEGRS